MSDCLVVLLKTAAMFLVILLGWLARRRRQLTAETTGTLSRLVVDMTFPALVFTQMLKTVDSQALRQDWVLPLFGAGILVIAGLTGTLASPLFARKEQKPTFIFLSGVPNWIYLPLPIVEVLFGAPGVRTVLLYNVGAQAALWTLGVWTLRGAMPDWPALRALLLNPGLIATALGIVLAVWMPSSHYWETIVVSQATPFQLVCATGVQALAMLGSLTIPLSLLVTGAQLGGLPLSSRSPSRDLPGVIAVRLFLAPLVTLGIVRLAALAGAPIADVPRLVGYLIAAMPVAISCSIFTERFGGDVSLSARSIFYTTLWSILTVPAIYSLIRFMGW